MTDRLVPVGRVGRPHGLDGSFYVEQASAELAEGGALVVAGEQRRVVRRAGTDDRPLVRLDGIEDRDAAAALRGEKLLAPEKEASLAEGEWLVEDLLRCEVPGLGAVLGVVAGPSCDLLEVGEERVLVPLVSDAVRRVDLDAGVIEVDLGFLALEGDGGE